MKILDFTQPERSKQDKMRDYNRKYREEHSEMVNCKCGGKFKEISKYTHVKTSRHQDFLATLRVNG